MSDEKTYQLAIQSSPRDQGHRIQLDGTEISNAIEGLQLELTSKDWPVARLDLVIWSGVTHDGQVRIELPDDAAALLKRLNWMPPDVVQKFYDLADEITGADPARDVVGRLIRDAITGAAG